MRCDQVFEPAAVERGEQRCRGLIVQVPEAAGDARLQRRRIRAARQQSEIVIALEHQRVAAGQVRLDMRRRAAGVGEHAEPARAVGKHVLDRLARIVRHRERVYQQIADWKSAARIDEVERALFLDAALLRAQRAKRTVRKPYRDSETARQWKYAVAVVGMLVRHDYSGEIGRLKARAGKA